MQCLYYENKSKRNYEKSVYETEWTKQLVFSFIKYFPLKIRRSSEEVFHNIVTKLKKIYELSVEKYTRNHFLITFEIYVETSIRKIKVVNMRLGERWFGWLVVV